MEDTDLRILLTSVGAVAVVAILVAQASAQGCASDAVRVGPVCVDKYEASVWRIPNPTTTNQLLVQKIQQGEATLSDLTAAHATQLGCPSAPYNHTAFPTRFPATGNWTPLAGSDPPTPGVYAVAVAGVLPTTCLTWFQSEQACALAGKRLLTNQEWQRAAAGTPDPGAADDGVTTCVTNSARPALTGSRANCKSSWGVFDMIGNIWERVADWADLNPTCTNWSAQTGFPGRDFSCWGGSEAPAFGFQGVPAAVTRGGSYVSGIRAGVFAVENQDPPSTAPLDAGFRCAR
jgi:hypothetical protein